LILFPFMLLLTLTVPACDGGSSEPEKSDTEHPGENGEGTEDITSGNNGRYLVLFCSRTGNTRAMAEEIRNVLNGDIVEVVPALSYDEDYNSMLVHAQREQAAIEQGNYPEISTSIESFDNYQTIFIGYPIRYGHMATPIQTFLYNHADKLSGKRIALFASSGSSGMSTSIHEARNLCPEAIFTETLLLTSAAMQQMESRIASWMGQLNISIENNMENQT
ncbi:MAG: hypothetical protein LUE93_11165, partial [Bacteroides sp.]|nr:hypothetical protein [Bacteroides sp.]